MFTGKSIRIFNISELNFKFFNYWNLKYLAEDVTDSFFNVYRATLISFDISLLMKWVEIYFDCLQYENCILQRENVNIKIKFLSIKLNGWELWNYIS